MYAGERAGFFVEVRCTKLFVESFTPGLVTKGKVLCLPGMGNYGWYFEPLVNHLSERGFAIYSTDYRGTGLSGGTRWDVPSRSDWIEDIHTIIHNLPDPVAPTYLLGHSLGGALALHSAPLIQEKLKGLIIVSPAMTVVQAHLPVINYLVFAFGMLCYHSRPLIKLPYPSMEDMIKNHADEDLAERLQQDPYRLDRISVKCGLTLSSMKKMSEAEKAASITNLPVLVICGEYDSALKGAVRYFNCVGAADKQLFTFPGKHHHLLRGNEKADVFESISDWLENHLSIQRQ